MRWLMLLGIYCAAGWAQSAEGPRFRLGLPAGREYVEINGAGELVAGPGDGAEFQLTGSDLRPLPNISIGSGTAYLVTRKDGADYAVGETRPGRIGLVSREKGIAFTLVPVAPPPGGWEGPDGRRSSRQRVAFRAKEGELRVGKTGVLYLSSEPLPEAGTKEFFVLRVVPPVPSVPGERLTRQLEKDKVLAQRIDIERKAVQAEYEDPRIRLLRERLYREQALRHMQAETPVPLAAASVFIENRSTKRVEFVWYQGDGARELFAVAAGETKSADMRGRRDAVLRIFVGGSLLEEYLPSRVIDRLVCFRITGNLASAQVEECR